jgi:hypothetical protein
MFSFCVLPKNVIKGQFGFLWQKEFARHIKTLHQKHEVFVYRKGEIVFEGYGLDEEDFDNLLQEGDVIFTCLDGQGELTIGGRFWALFSKYPNSQVIIHITKGKNNKSFIDRVEVLDAPEEDRIKIFSRIYEGEVKPANLKDVFYYEYGPDKFNKLSEGDKIVTFLNNRGYLTIGGRMWARFRKYPNSKVIVHTTKGKNGITLIDKVEILEAPEAERVKVFSRIYESTIKPANLKDVFYSDFSSNKFNKLTATDVISTQLDNNGYLSIGGKRRAQFSEYANRRILVYLIKGEDEKGEKISLIDRVEILNERGSIEKQIQFGRLYEDGKLKNTFYHLSSQRFSKLNEVWLKNLYLDGEGKVEVIPNKKWLICEDCPYHKVSLWVIDGGVVLAKIIDKKGNVIDTIEFSPPLH